MTRARLTILASLAAVALLPSPAAAQRLALTLSPRIVSFPASDPDVIPLVIAAPIQVTYQVQQNSNAPWSLTVLAGGDLISGPSTVDIANISWVATPAPPFQSGTLSKTIAQRLASGNGNVNPASIGSVTFRLANSWNYSAGTYTQTVIFTLTAP